MGWKGGIRAGKKKGGIMISMYNVGGGGKGKALQHREDSDSTTSYYADGQ